MVTALLFVAGMVVGALALMVFLLLAILRD